MGVKKNKRTRIYKGGDNYTIRIPSYSEKKFLEWINSDETSSGDWINIINKYVNEELVDISELKKLQSEIKMLEAQLKIYEKIIGNPSNISQLPLILNNNAIQITEEVEKKPSEKQEIEHFITIDSEDSANNDIPMNQINHDTSKKEIKNEIPSKADKVEDVKEDVVDPNKNSKIAIDKVEEDEAYPNLNKNFTKRRRKIHNMQPDYALDDMENISSNFMKNK